MFVYKKNSKVSKKSRLFPFTRFTNSSIKERSYVGLFGFVNNTDIGKYCSISMNFKSGLGKHPTNFISTSPLFYSKGNRYAMKDYIDPITDNFEEYSKIKIGNDVWIGADVLVMDGVTISDGAIIGSKSVVNKDVPAYSIVAGTPAKLIRYRFSDEIIEELLRINWWNWDREKIVANKKWFSQPLNLEILKNMSEL